MPNPINPYPAYNPPSVEWIGDVPAHWEIRRLRTVAELRVSNVDKHTKEGEIPIRLCNYADVYKNDRITSAMPFMNATASQGEIEKFHLKKGDVLITKDSETWDDIGVPALVTEPAMNLISGYHLALLRPFKEAIGPYLALTLQSKPVAYQFHVRANGVTRYGLTHAGIQSVRIPLPPLLEQNAIVRFLDHADRRIRRYIRAKQKQIALLEEQKQAIIHHAVTGQIDVRTGQPYPAYKDSGVEWLVEVPVHWAVLPLKRAFGSMEYGISDSGSDDGTIGLLTMGNVRDGTVTVPTYGGVTSVDPTLLLQDKDLLFNRTNSPDLVAKVGLFRSQGRPITFASYLVRMRTGPENSPEYLNLLLNDVGFVSVARRAAIPSLHQSNLNPTRYGRLKIPLPPQSEQEAIVQGVTEWSSVVNSAIVKTNREIDHLREYRTRLIADVVTGKLDVRDAAAELPEEDLSGDAEESAEEYKIKTDLTV